MTAAALTDAERALLDRLLAEHRAAAPDEARHRERIQGFVARHANPFDRTITEGHLTSSAFVLDDRGRVLLTHHRKLGKWLQLGGHSDGERAAHDVAFREAREESGLADLSFHPSLSFDDGTPRLLDCDVHDIPARGDEPKHQHHDLRFLLETARPQDIVVNPRETRALEWVTLEEAERRGDRSLSRAIERVREVLGWGA